MIQVILAIMGNKPRATQNTLWKCREGEQSEEGSEQVY